MDHFLSVTQQIRDRAFACLRDNVGFDSEFESDGSSIYIKSNELKITYGNAAYHRLFAPDRIPTGRSGEAFLQETIIPVSKASDEMILRGCPRVYFDHFGHTADGQAMMFRSAKISLQEAGHPAFGILGITIVKEIASPEEAVSAQTAALSHQWHLFSNLKASDREVAVRLAQGRTTSQIAAELSLSKRTIENHRNHILQTLDLDSPVELIKLLVKLQERGFGDLGI